jgi:hypothetical protein
LIENGRQGRRSREATKLTSKIFLTNLSFRRNCGRQSLLPEIPNKDTNTPRKIERGVAIQVSGDPGQVSPRMGLASAISMISFREREFELVNN